jgi:DDE family transposase
LIFQRLHHDHTLEKVVSDAHAGGAEALCCGLSKKLRSLATVSYSNARQRLPLAFLRESFALQARRLLALNPHTLWHGLAVCLLDGSTVRLRPYGNIARRFPPNGNQAPAAPYWCLMRVVVGFCARSGAALECARGSFYRSEQVLACRMMLRRVVGACLYIGDRNFGVFRIVQTARTVGCHVLVRLTESRARRLLGRPLRLGQHALLWSATASDQLQRGCPKDPIAGRLLVVRVHRRGYRSQTLYLFTTLTDPQEFPLAELVDLYGLRWHIELNLRYLKSQMRLVQLECKSAEMAQKEWLAGLMAYNLIRAAMLCAALRQGISPLLLSFSMSHRHLEHWLALFAAGTARGRQWHQLLERVGRARLPRRRKARPPEPRAQRHLRQPYPPLIGSRKKARQQLQKTQKCSTKN